jgi:hypothetical protein
MVYNSREKICRGDRKKVNVTSQGVQPGVTCCITAGTGWEMTDRGYEEQLWNVCLVLYDV